MIWLGRQSPEIGQPRSGSTTQQLLDSPKIRRSATATQVAPNQNWGYSNDHLQLGRQNSLYFSSTRPMSAPTTSDGLPISQWIPPKRELPFPKPKESKKAVQLASKPKSDSENKSMLQSVPDTHEEREGKRAVARKTSTPPTSALPPTLEIPDSDYETTRSKNALGTLVVWEEEPSPLASKSTAIVRPSVASGLKSKATSTIKRSNEAVAKVEAAKKVKMVDTGTQTQTLSGRDHTASIARAATVTAEQVVPAPVPGPTPTPILPVVDSGIQRPPADFMDDLELLVSKYGGKRKPVELWEIPGWTTATDEERYSMTQHWICMQLEDPSFLDLCKHVENVWQRIGFEL